MNRMPRRLSTLLLVTCIVTGTVTTTRPEIASAASRTEQADERTQATPTEPSYPSATSTGHIASAGREPSAALALATCPSGWFCFYDEAGFGQPYGKLSSCGWQNLATWGWQNRIDAAYYNLPKGSAAFYESSGTFLFQVSATNRSLSDVYPLQNRADKVYRSC